jgi:hypothetical protein
MFSLAIILYKTTLLTTTAMECELKKFDSTVQDRPCEWFGRLATVRYSWRLRADGWTDATRTIRVLTVDDHALQRGVSPQLLALNRNAQWVGPLTTTALAFRVCAILI